MCTGASDHDARQWPLSSNGDAGPPVIRRDQATADAAVQSLAQWSPPINHSCVRPMRSASGPSRPSLRGSAPTIQRHTADSASRHVAQWWCDALSRVLGLYGNIRMRLCRGILTPSLWCSSPFNGSIIRNKCTRKGLIRLLACIANVRGGTITVGFAVAEWKL